MSETNHHPDATVDARGATCPGPLMDLVGELRGADPGTVVELLSDNEQSTSDVPEWAAESGNEVLDIEDEGDYYRILVEKA